MTPSDRPDPETRRVRSSFRALAVGFCILVAVATATFSVVILPELEGFETILLVVLVVPFVGYFTYFFGYAAVTGRRPITWFTRR